MNMKRNSISKNIILLLTSAVVAASLTGCGSAIPNMTDSQLEEIGDYAGVVLLKYDASHRSRLVDVSDYEDLSEDEEEQAEEVSETENPEEKPEGKTDETTTGEQTDELPEETSDTENSAPEVVDVSGETTEPEVQKSFAEFVGFPEGVTVTCTGYEWADEYSGEGAESYFSIDASEGKMLLIVTYEISNGTGENLDVDFLNAGLSFKAGIGSETRAALPAWLLDDNLSSYVGTIQAGSYKKLVMLFEFGTDAAYSTENVNIIVRSTESSYTECID